MHFDGELMTPETRPPRYPKAAKAHYLTPMCGRITQRSGELPGLVTVEGYGDSRVKTRAIGYASTERRVRSTGSSGSIPRPARTNATA